MKVKNRFKILILIIILCCLVLPCAFLRAAQVGNFAHAADIDTSYVFNQIHVEAEVRKDKTVAVTETMTVNWQRERTSLIRDVQKVSRTTRIINGKEKKGKRYFAKISDVSATLDGGECRWQFIPENDDFYLPEFFSIEMQKPAGRFADGETNVFVLSYVYDMSDDKAFGYDDFTFDILGYAMARTIGFSATVIFPESVNAENFSMRTVPKGFSNKIAWEPDEAKGESFEISGNTVKISAFPAAAGKGYTLQYILPDGYFITDGITFYWYYIIFAVIAFAAIIAGLCVFIVNLPKKPLRTVELYPPEGISLMRFSSIFHRGARMKDCAALILKWAAAGIIRAEADGERNLILYPVIPPSPTGGKRKKRGKKQEEEIDVPVTGDTVAVPVEETPEIIAARKAKKLFNKQENEFYDRLFSGIGGKDCFSTSYFMFKASRTDKEQFYKAANGLVKEGNKPETVNAKKLKKCKFIMAALSLVPFISIMLYLSIICDGWLMMFVLPFMAAGTVVPLVTMPSGKFHLFSFIFFTAFSSVFFFMPYSVLVIGTYGNIVYDYLNLALVLPAWWVISTFVLTLPFFMGRREKSAQDKYGAILGFKHFLLTAELPRIQLLFDENPDYFAEIVPYCLIMGISKKVKKRFKALQIEIPEYYGGLSEGALVRCVSTSIMISSFSSSSGRSGGGFSGGGGFGGSSGGGGGGGGSRSR